MYHFIYNHHAYVWFIIFLTIYTSNSQQIFIAQIILSNPGTQFIPVNMAAQLILTAFTDSAKKCAMLCTTNILCRVYDYEVSIAKECRLFEGDTKKLGQIVSSSSAQSIAGTVRLSPDLFAEYGKPCISFCFHSRYLQCGNNLTCECMPHTYWNATASICMPQSPILGAPCQQNITMCRQDLSYTCLQFNQCGRKLHSYLYHPTII